MSNKMNLLTATSSYSIIRWTSLILLASGPLQEVVADLRVGAFNIQVFGVTKAGKPEVMDILTKIVRRYDLLLIQEIRDATNTSIWSLYNQVNAGQPADKQFSIELSPRLGRTLSKEQYAFFYRPGQGLEVVQAYVPNDTAEDIFEREPYVVHFRSNNTVLTDFVLVALHTRPDDVVDELNGLPDVIDEAKSITNISDVMVLGDLNTECASLPLYQWVNVELATDPQYNWLIGNESDTTVRNTTDCAYDRFITTGSQWAGKWENATVYKFNEDTALLGPINDTLALDVSDHFAIDLILLGNASQGGEPPVYNEVTLNITDVYVDLEDSAVGLEIGILYDILNISESMDVLTPSGDVIASLTTDRTESEVLMESLENAFPYIVTTNVQRQKRRYAGRQRCFLLLTTTEDILDDLMDAMKPTCDYSYFSCSTA